MAVYEVTLKVHIYTYPTPSREIAVEHALAQLQAVPLEEAAENVRAIEFIAAETTDDED